MEGWPNHKLDQNNINQNTYYTDMQRSRICPYNHGKIRPPTSSHSLVACKRSPDQKTSHLALKVPSLTNPFDNLLEPELLKCYDSNSIKTSALFFVILHNYWVIDTFDTNFSLTILSVRDCLSNKYSDAAICWSRCYCVGTVV